MNTVNDYPEAPPFEVHTLLNDLCMRSVFQLTKGIVIIIECAIITILWPTLNYHLDIQWVVMDIVIWSQRYFNVVENSVVTTRVWTRFD